MKKLITSLLMVIAVASVQAQTPITVPNGDFSSGSTLSGLSPWTISGWTISQNTGLSAAGNAAVTAASSGVVSGALKLVGTNSTALGTNNLNQAAAIVESDKIDISGYAGSTSAFTFAFQIKVATATGSAAPWNVVTKVYDASNVEVLSAIGQTKSQGNLKTTAAGTYVNASVVGTLLGAASANVKYITIQVHLGQILANTPTLDNFTLNAAGAAATTTLTQPASTALSYEIGTGPSAEQSFQVAGANLGSNNVTITPGASIELSTASGSGFASSAITLIPASGTVATTTLYARLIAGQNLGSVGTNAARQVNIAAIGTTTKTIQFTGVVNGITSSIAGGTSIGYTVGAGPSAKKTNTVQGYGLTNDLVVAPGSNMEVTLDTLTAYASSPITLTQTGGIVAATPIYTRLIAGLSVGTYSDATTKITATSVGYTSKEVAFTGNVTLVAPVATDASVLTGNSAFANWGAVIGATGYIVTVTNLTDAILFGPFTVSDGAVTSKFMPLQSNTQYNYTVKATANGVSSPASNVIAFELNQTTALNNSKIGKIYVSNGQLVVEGASAYNVYNAQGVEVAKATKANDRVALRSGIYFVKVGNKTEKVIVK